MRLFRHTIIVALLLSLAGCISFSGGPQLTALEKQTLQSRQYDDVTTDIAFASVTSVFLDLGYSVTSTDKAAGMIVAESAADSSGFSKWIFGVSQVTQTKVTAFIEKIGSKTNVRLNFVSVEKSSTEFGQSDREDEQILDAQIYQNAFEQIEAAIFLRKSNS